MLSTLAKAACHPPGAMARTQAPQEKMGLLLLLQSQGQPLRPAHPTKPALQTRNGPRQVRAMSHKGHLPTVWSLEVLLLWILELQQSPGGQVMFLSLCCVLLACCSELGCG